MDDETILCGSQCQGPFGTGAGFVRLGIRETRDCKNFGILRRHLHVERAVASSARQVRSPVQTSSRRKRRSERSIPAYRDDHLHPASSAAWSAGMFADPRGPELLLQSNSLNSLRRPSLTALRKAGSPKSAKNWKGADSSYSCPIQSMGVCGASRAARPKLAPREEPGPSGARPWPDCQPGRDSGCRSRDDRAEHPWVLSLGAAQK